MILLDVEHKVPILHSENNHLDLFPLAGWSPPYPESDSGSDSDDDEDNWDEYTNE